MAGTALSGANEFIEAQLDVLAAEIEADLEMDLYTYVGPLIYGSDDLTRDLIETRSSRRPSLAVVIETTGGFIEPVRRMVNVFRHSYSDRVEFIVPGFAMSAGTILVMSGDAIHMDYYSVLGPIDPQVQNQDGELIPALGFLVKYERLLRKANAGKASSAEVALLLNFNQAELYSYEQDRELSIALLKEWLVKYKFKDWTETESRKLPVTQQMKEQRARDIARILNKTDKWHSHGHGITMEVLSRDLNLIVDDFGDQEKAPWGDKVRAYHTLLIDYSRRIGKGIIAHRPGKVYY